MTQDDDWLEIMRCNLSATEWDIWRDSLVLKEAGEYAPVNRRWLEEARDNLNEVLGEEK